MDSVVRLITSIQVPLQLLALVAALVALYELAAERDWRRRPVPTAARVVVFVLCGAVGLTGLLLGQNAVLLLADRLGAPLGPVQAGFLIALVLGVFGWVSD
jgi:ABC-type nitrate/sulfonate/bicarbonate transport system permease component